jgi:hypothetical protein
MKELKTIEFPLKEDGSIDWTNKMKNCRPLNKQIKKEIIALVDAGLNFQQIARHYGKKDRQWARYHYRMGKGLGR